MPFSIFSRYLKCSEMLKAEDALLSINLYSFPHLKSDGDRKKIIDDLKRGSKRFIERKLATMGNILEQVKASRRN